MAAGLAEDVVRIESRAGGFGMGIGERILLLLSRAPEDNDYLQEDSELDIDNALQLLTRMYPNFGDLVSGRRVVDFGCGTGYQSIALVKKYGCAVVGIDSNRDTLRRAAENARQTGVSSQSLSFVEGILPDMVNRFDVVISQNSFEHFPEPGKVLREMTSLLNDSGIALVTFGPPWFAPYGSHMHFFCRVPWINVLFSESVVMKARSHFRNDGAKRYEEVESGLNRMSIARFESIVSSCGLKVKYRKYECVKRIDWLSKVPLLREFFINHVTVTLSKVTG
jgi:SAM-dependent methyltransferase